MIKNIIILFILFSLVACAAPAPSPYKAKKHTHGYSEIKINSSSYHISFRGNSNTYPERVADFAMLRAAEVTIIQGYDYLRIISFLNKYTIEQVNMSFPVLKQEVHTAYTVKDNEVCKVTTNDTKQRVVILNDIGNSPMQDNHNLYRDDIYITNTWVQETQIHKIKNPTSEINIAFVNERYKNDHDVKNAHEIINKITKKYQIKLNAI